MNTGGKIYFWKYKTDEIAGEWHGTADSEGCGRFLELLEETAKSYSPASIEIELTPVTQEILRLPDYNSPSVSMSTLLVRYDPAAAVFYEWKIVQNGTTVELSVGRRMLAELTRAMSDLKARSADYTIGIDEDYTVFFWNHAQVAGFRS